MCRSPCLHQLLSCGHLLWSQDFFELGHVALRFTLALLCSEREPHISSGVIRGDSITRKIQHPKMELGGSVTLFRCALPPTNGFGVIAGDSFPFGVDAWT